ncbi:hypothetical protein N7475_008644 [Penicillium sp. IBT 31633x]|nr:hypothetical protein N7475_008644 [Penicillium sp. IBT 31633x]
MAQSPRNGRDCRDYRDEILVHIAAASTAHDDARYRAQVAAILDFQCVSRQPLMATQIEPDPDRDYHAHPIAATAGVHLHSSPSITQHEASPIVREASRPAVSTLYSDLPSRPERDGAAPREHISNHHASLESLISVIPDSQPEIANELVYASPSRAALSSPSQDDPPPKRPRTTPTSPDHPDSSPNPIPTPSAPDQPTAPPRVNPIQSQPSNPISIPGSDHDPFPTSQPHPPNTLESPSNPPTITLPSLPLQIHPPKPPISTAPFTTHLTPTLSMLTERLTPSRIYNPSHQSRPLDPLERGYWLVRFAVKPQDLTSNPEETHIWPEPLFNAFWSFLRDFVGRDGRAGWGVWCILEADSDSSCSAATQLVLKVYTWGEVAMHVYLLLFLASERRVRRMGMQWRDAREEVVIQMP